MKTSLLESTNDITIQTQPSGAKVYYKPYKDVDGEWITLGVTPIDKVRVPVGMHRWRVQKDGYQERELAYAVLPRIATREVDESAKAQWGNPLTFQWELYKESDVPEGTIGVDRVRFQMALHGLFDPRGIVLEPFFLDRTEVTNSAYKEFLKSGGYTDPKYWKQEFKKGGQVIPWAEAIKLFVDRTGQPGPSTWELGDYPEGTG